MMKPAQISKIILVCVLLSGCGGVGSTQWFNQTSLAQQAEHFRSICLTYGFQPETDALAQCVAEERRATQLHNLLERQATQSAMDELMRSQLLRHRCLRSDLQCN